MMSQNDKSLNSSTGKVNGMYMYAVEIMFNGQLCGRDYGDILWWQKGRFFPMTSKKK